MQETPIRFFNPAGEYGAFSLEYPCFFYIGHLPWKSCSLYLLAEHFSDLERVQEVHDARRLDEAQKISRGWPVRQDWDLVKDRFLEEALRAKFDVNCELRYQLMATGDRDLIFEDMLDPDWGVGPDGEGKNRAGKILMSLRARYLERWADRDALQCFCSEVSGKNRVCEHLLLETALPTSGYYRFFTSDATDFAIICPACRENLETAPEHLRWVCSDCFMTLLEKQCLGQTGSQKIMTRPGGVSFSHQEIDFHLSCGDILDIKPLEGEPGNLWLGITADRQFIQLDFDRKIAKDLCAVPSSHIDWRVKVELQVSRDGWFAAIANRYGQYGVVVDLKSGRATLNLDRQKYHVEHSRFPLAFAEVDGKTILVHATDWNRVTISDPETGRELTRRELPVWKQGEPLPEHYLDYFHGRLVVSPDHEQIADWGWVWQPRGMIRSWNLRKWLRENPWESEDWGSLNISCEREYFWDGPICWMDPDRLVVWGYGSDDLNLIPAVSIYNMGTGKILRWFSGPACSKKTIIYFDQNGKKYEKAVPAAELFFDESLFCCDPEYGTSVWDIETGERLLLDPAFCPDGYNPGSQCFLTILPEGKFRISRLLCG